MPRPAARCSSPFTRSAMPCGCAIASSCSVPDVCAARARLTSSVMRHVPAALHRRGSKRSCLPSRSRGWPTAAERRAVGWLLRKEWRDLMASRSWWVMLALIGPLAGLSFINAVRTYGELSDANGTAAGVGEAFAPLVGIWAPTFSACELAAAFLLPFVAIRLVAGDRQSGALKLELQHPMPALTRMTAKALVLLCGWLIASAPPMAALGLWRMYGGTIYWPEIAAVTAGHVLNAGLTVALACAMASLTDHPSTAAILTLSVTVGTWILNFAAAIHGGVWERAAAYTPTA